MSPINLLLMNGDYQLAQQFFIFGSFRLIIRIMRWFGAVTHCVMNLKENNYGYWVESQYWVTISGKRLNPDTSQMDPSNWSICSRSTRITVPRLPKWKMLVLKVNSTFFRWFSLNEEKDKKKRKKRRKNRNMISCVSRSLKFVTWRACIKMWTVDVWNLSFINY